MAKDFRTRTARIHRGLNRLEKVLLETRRTGAFVPRGVSAVLAGGGRRNFTDKARCRATEQTREAGGTLP